jgi:hypothetical protein
MAPKRQAIMSDKSPLFVSALELIAHATELFAQKNPKKYKFIILHLANAVELILKDHVLDQGISIYEGKTNKTIGLWDCIKTLEGKGITFPELPIIELLIDDRNTIQHRFGYPSAESTYYYIEQVVSFFQRFLNQYYGIQLAEALGLHLSEEHLKLLGLAKDESNYVDTLDKIAKISIESAILRAFGIIEEEVLELLEPFLPRTRARQMTSGMLAPHHLRKLLDDFRQKGYATTDIEKFRVLQEARNYAAHRPGLAPPNISWQKAFDIAKELLIGLQKARDSGYTFTQESEINTLE